MIVANAGHEGAVVVGKVKSKRRQLRLQRGDREFGDLVKAGVIDPTKVTRLALRTPLPSPA